MTARHLTLSSAILCALAYTFDRYTGWMIIPGLALMILASTRKRAYITSDAILWGTLFWGWLYAPLAQVIIDHGQGSAKLSAYAFLLAYQVLTLILLFAILRRSASDTHAFDSIARATVIIGIYWVYISLGSFWIFGSITGYCTAIPLIPLIHYASARLIISCAHPVPALVVPIILAMMLAVLIAHRKTVILTLALIILATVECMIPSPDHQSDWLETIGVIVPAGGSTESHVDRLQAIVCAQQDLLRRHPTISTMLLPESAVPLCVDKHPWISDLFDPNVLTIFGGFYSNNDYRKDACLSSILSAHDSRITKCYDKIKPLPFTEFVPAQWQWIKGLSTLFLNGKNSIISRSPTQPSMIWLGAPGFAQPYLCSDLFYDTTTVIKGRNNDLPILFLVNDSWFSHLMMPRLLRNYGILIALMLQRTVLYIGYYYQLVIWPDGTYKELLK